MKLDRWHQLESLYNKALEVDESRRVVFLREACAGDDELRHEVERLLAARPAAASFLEQPALQEIAHEFAASAGPSHQDYQDHQDWIGREVGNYQFVSLVGVGGMGEVYRARDTRLKRDVAIKVIPDQFSRDPARISRFQREAELLASLNHPNIAAIYDLEELNGSRFLILEMVPGETVADRIRRGPIPVEEALKIALQIAEALEAAHERNVIHRDLKPANIKVTVEGTVKVLDFGLAKALADERTAEDITRVTLPLTATSLGVILGTPAYMSPEQATGKPVDRRADIWAFGVVLYELLTGKPAFQGEDVTEILTAVMTREPVFDALPAKTPAAIRNLLRRCLEKNLKRRLQHIGEARILIEGALSGAASVEHDTRAVTGAGPKRRMAFLMAAVLLLLAAGAGAAYLMKPSVPVTSPSEYVQLTDFTDSAVAPSLSPDGKMVAFKRGPDSFLTSGHIYVKLLPNGEPRQLTIAAGRAFAPVFTPDGSRVVYSTVAAGSWDTWTIPVLGGQPSQLLPNSSALTWVDDKTVMFSEIKMGLHMGVVTATESRANLRDIYIDPNEHSMAHYSYASPDRKSILVVEMNSTHAFNEPCRLVPFDGKSKGRQVGPHGTCTAAAWSPDGRWMYFGATVEGTAHLWRQRFPDGAPEQITFGPLEEEGVAIAPDGRSLITSVGTRRNQIWLHDRAGERAISSEGHALSPRLSIDGKRLFFLLVKDWWLSGTTGWVAAAAELRSIDLASGKNEPVLPGVSATSFDLSRDEREVAFTTTSSDGESEIWLAPLDRSSSPRRLVQGGDQVSFGQEGTLVFRLRDEKTTMLVRMKRDGTGQERISPIIDKFGVSPDGQWVIVNSPESDKAGYSTLAISLAGGSPEKICAGGCPSFWSADGRFLYVVRSGKTFVFPVAAGKSLPDLPSAGIGLSTPIPGATVIEQSSISPGSDPSTYFFTKSDNQRNLFRIPLH